MRAENDHLDGEKSATARAPRAVVQEMRLFGEAVQTPALFRAWDWPDGTISAAIRAEDRHFYGGDTEMVTRGVPVRREEAPPAPPATSGLRAKDLIAELHSINTQIHRIMFQVERAVAKLATNAS